MTCTSHSVFVLNFPISNVCCAFLWSEIFLLGFWLLNKGHFLSQPFCLENNYKNAHCQPAIRQAVRHTVWSSLTETFPLRGFGQRGEILPAGRCVWLGTFLNHAVPGHSDVWYCLVN